MRIELSKLSYEMYRNVFRFSFENYYDVDIFRTFVF